MTGLEQELFVYYRAAPQDAAALEAAVRDMQAGLTRQYRGLSARLLRRAEVRDGLVTWMEAYAWPAGEDPATLSSQRRDCDGYRARDVRRHVAACGAPLAAGRNR